MECIGGRVVERLNFTMRQTIGFQFLMDQMTANTVYGSDQIKQVTPFGRKEKDQLRVEYEEIECLIAAIDRNDMELSKIELILMFIKEIRGSIRNLQEMSLNDIELFEIKNFLIQIEKIVPLFEEWNQQLGLKTVWFQDVSVALNLLDPEEKRIPSFYISDRYSDSLKEVREQKKKMEVALRQELSEEKRQEYVKSRMNAVATEAELEQEIRGQLSNQLRPFLPLMQELTNMVGRLDFLIQKARVALKFGGTKPLLTNESIELIKVIHPELDLILKEKDKRFTPITIQMDQGVTVLTGANMGGKSVALRTIFLNLYLAQCGFYPYGEQVCFPVFDYMTFIAEEYQSMKDGLSSFGGEIIALKDALGMSDRGFGFLMMDELARGTNPDEGAAIVRAVVKYCNPKKQLTLLATHYDHVAEHGSAHYQVYGLKNMDMDKIKQQIALEKDQNRISFISKCMNYGIYKVTQVQDCPKDAFHVCKLLGLQEDVISYMEQD